MVIIRVDGTRVGNTPPTTKRLKQKIITKHPETRKLKSVAMVLWWVILRKRIISYIEISKD